MRERPFSTLWSIVENERSRRKQEETVDTAEAHARVLDAAETLFYQRGVQVVGMDELRAAAGVSLKRMYQCFPSKDALLAAYLRRRDERWRTSLSDYVERHAVNPADRVPAIFRWLRTWFATPDFRGCAFINSFGELGAVSDVVADAVRDHQRAVRAYLADLLAPRPNAEQLAEQLLMLIAGATVLAAVHRDAGAAHRAATVAATLCGPAATDPVSSGIPFPPSVSE
jgi:AcrR family transcriptional regulator